MMTDDGFIMMGRKMKGFSVLVLLISLMVILPWTSYASSDETPPPWQGKDKYGNVITEEKLKEILADHKAWIIDGMKKEDSRRLDLRHAELEGADLAEENLLSAYLQGTHLQGANLQKTTLKAAHLEGAHLEGASLQEANLEGASLQGANLQKTTLKAAHLEGAHLEGANLEEANLEGASLEGANLAKVSLQGAELVRTNIKNAIFFKTSLKNTLYEPSSAPHKGFLGGIELEGIWFNKEQHCGLVLLRSAFKDVGLREREREATYFIERGKRKYAPLHEKVVKFFFFEMTCGYGFYTWRPLIFVVLSFVFLSFIYMIPIYDSTGNRLSTIYCVWSDKRIRQDLGPKNSIIASEPLKMPNYKALTYAFYFSFLSVFHFGWGDINVGNWIARIQPQEWSFRATGWVRTVSGIQSIVSIYLVALWALSYFGRPFG
ncbi:pentapeptide repeat-containing protein [Thermodesulfobacteriota bacterium]